MKQLFSFTDEQLENIRNGDIEWGYCERCEMYFDGLVAELAFLDNQITTIDYYCARRLPPVPEWARL